MSLPLSLRRLALLLALAGAAFAGGLRLAAQEAPRSPRNASYTIDVRLDPQSRTLTGRQVLHWRNLQPQETSELWFHLYWNGWRNNRSTWLLEDRIRGRSSAAKNPPEEDWAFQVVDSVRLLNVSGSEPPAQEEPLIPLPLDLSAALRFASPDDGNPEDRTVLVVDLPFAVQPGQSIQVEMSWKAKIPRTFARTGFQDDFYFIAHWFPKLGVFEPTGWNCHQFHSATEFYSDYGVYSVRLTLPENFTVGATGKLEERRPQADGTVTHHYVAQDVHGFAWTASPHFLEFNEAFEEPGLPPVEMRLLLQPEHEAQAERHFQATRASLKFYGTWFGPYPYEYLTIVDPAYGSGAGGMEYPTLFTAGTRIFNPAGGGSPEGVTVHEAGHQFWYGAVGNNEFEHAWLDEGLNTFSTARTYQEAWGDPLYVRRYLSLPGRGDRSAFLPILFPQLKLSREVYGNRMDRYRHLEAPDAQGRPTYLYYPANASSISYNKTALWLATLERFLGWEVLQQILSTFYERWQFRHPQPEDFFALANEVAGQDLSWFFDQVHGGSQTFDYAIERAESGAATLQGFQGPEQGLVFRAGQKDRGDDDPGEASTLYRTEVTVQRRGDGVFPIDVLLVFEDGEQILRSWDGQGRWRLFVEERTSRLAYAEADPQRILQLDIDRTNNSRMRDSKARLPAVKWASRWMIWLQDALQTFTFFL